MFSEILFKFHFKSKPTFAKSQQPSRRKQTFQLTEIFVPYSLSKNTPTAEKYMYRCLVGTAREREREREYSVSIKIKRSRSYIKTNTLQLSHHHMRATLRNKTVNMKSQTFLSHWLSDYKDLENFHDMVETYDLLHLKWFELVSRHVVTKGIISLIFYSHRNLTFLNN